MVSPETLAAVAAISVCKFDPVYLVNIAQRKQFEFLQQ